MSPTPLTPQERAAALEQLDARLAQLLQRLHTVQFEEDESDKLVSDLQEMIATRHALIAELVADEQCQDQDYIQALARRSQEFESGARKIFADREALLGTLRKGRRQTNIYKKISLNR